MDHPVKATLHGILDLFGKKTPIGKLDKEQRIDDKVCLVTGANSGLGFAIAQQLAERGGKVIMACRSGIPEAGEKIKDLSGSSQVEMMKVDLSDIDSIMNLVQELKNKEIKLDIAVFNAAMVPSGSRKGKSGLDEMFMVNYLSKFLLVNQLLKHEIIPIKDDTIPRILFVSSESHRVNRPIDIQQLGIYEEYTMSKVIGFYGYYKLLLNTFAAELERRLNTEKTTKCAVHVMCPGAVNSNIAKESPAIFKPLIKVIFSLFFASPTKAAEPVLYLACSPEIEGKSHIYLHLMQQKQMDDKALNVDNGEKLWKKSEELLLATVQ